MKLLASGGTMHQSEVLTWHHPSILGLLYPCPTFIPDLLIASASLAILVRMSKQRTLDHNPGLRRRSALGLVSDVFTCSSKWAESGSGLIAKPSVGCPACRPAYAAAYAASNMLAKGRESLQRFALSLVRPMSVRVGSW